MSINNILGQTAFWMVNKTIAKKVGVRAALLLSDLIGKRDILRQKENVDEFYYTSEEIEENTTLSYKVQRTCLNELIEAGFISITQKGLPKRQYFSINDNAILSELEIQAFPIGQSKSCPNGNTGVDQTATLYNNNINNKNNNKEYILERFGIKEDELNVSSQTIRKIASKFEKLEFPYDDKEFLKLFFILCTTKKWRAKEVNTLQMQLKKISSYEVGFSKLLIEESIANEWQGLVYENTDDKYRKWKGGNKLNIVKFNNEKTYEEF